MIQFTRINQQQAQELLDKGNAVLVDIRDTESYESGHVKGAINLTQATIATFIETTDKSTSVLVMCYHGNSSQSVAHYFAQQGFTDVYSIDGGYEMWTD